jgi:hypothetical protein
VGLGRRVLGAGRGGGKVGLGLREGEVGWPARRHRCAMQHKVSHIQVVAIHGQQGVAMTLATRVA